MKCIGHRSPLDNTGIVHNGSAYYIKMLEFERMEDTTCSDDKYEIATNVHFRQRKIGDLPHLFYKLNHLGA